MNALRTLRSISRRPAWIVPGLAAALFLVAGPAIAQAWPNRPVRLVVPYVPGGATDLVSRIVGEQLTVGLGQQLVVDNRPGATGTIAFTGVSAAEADGYTLITTADSLTVVPFSYKNLKSRK